jgi:methionyl-tRNA formyltransferase
MAVLLLTKDTDFCEKAVTLARIIFGRENVHWSSPATAYDGPFVGAGLVPYDALISFLSPWIVPSQVLAAQRLAINFHPGTRDYPGFASYSFALYDGAIEFGAICHHITPQIDAGPIIAERRFPVFPTDDVETLKFRTMVELLSLFHAICATIRRGEPLPAADLSWSRKATSSKDMMKLGEVTTDMSPDEVARRVRAMSYPGTPGPFVTVDGQRFHRRPPDRKPIA